MDHTTQVSLLERVLALLDAKTTDMVERSSCTDPRRYFDAATLERERLLFRRLPLAIAHESRLAERGGFFTHDDAGVPLLFSRAADGGGGVLAFLNVCRHRGTRVENAPCGVSKRSFVCPYHGWTYDPRGALLHIPHEEGFRDVERGSLALTRLACDTRAGFLWVTTSPGGACDAAAHLGAFAAELEGFDLASHAVYRPGSMRKAFNWKIAVEIFFEAYHVKRTHSDSIYPIFFDNVALFDHALPHLRNFFPKRSITALRGTDPASWRLRARGNLLYYIFPNTMMLVQPDHVSVFHIFPRGTDETDIHYYTLVPEPPTTEKAQRYWDKNVDILIGAVTEDMAMGESIQRGLRSGANDVFHFGRYEQSLEYFQQEIERALS